MRHWYLVHSKPRRERAALANLERQGYRAYLPLMRSRRRIAGRYQSRVEAMFPRYLFLDLDDTVDDWGPIRSTVGVSQLVRFGPRAARVPDALVQALKAREDEDGVQVLPRRGLKAGERVRIVEGPMAGYEAVYQARSGQARVIVLLEIAARTAAVSVREDDVEPSCADWSLTGSPTTSSPSGG